MISKNTATLWNIESEANTSDVLRLGKTLFQAILVKSLDILSEKEESELDALMDKDETTTEDVLKFLTSKIPTFDLLVSDERQKLQSAIAAV